MSLRVYRLLGFWVVIMLATQTGLVAGANPPPIVLVTTPLQRELTTFEFRGLLSPDQRMEVRAPLAGRVSRVLVKQGDQVKKGDLLLEIDSEAARAELQSAEVAVKRATTKVAQGAKALEEGKAKPASTKEDVSKLAAEHELAAVVLQLAQDAQERARKELELARVMSPMAARVEKLPVQVGDLVAAGIRSASLLCTLARTDPVRLSFDLDERTLLRLQRLLRGGKLKGTKVTDLVLSLRLHGEKGFPHQGKIEFIDNQIDVKTGRVQVQALLTDPTGKLAAVALDPDEKKRTARVQLPINEARPVLLIPERAVLSGSTGERFVLVVNERKVVEKRTVMVGGVQEDLQVIEDGLKPTDLVIFATERPSGAGQPSRDEDFGFDLRTFKVMPGTVVQPTTVKGQAVKPGKE